MSLRTISLALVLAGGVILIGSGVFIARSYNALQIACGLLMLLSPLIFQLLAWRHAADAVADLRRQFDELLGEPEPVNLVTLNARRIYVDMCRNNLEIAEAKVRNREWSAAHGAVAMGRQSISDYRRSQSGLA